MSALVVSVSLYEPEHIALHCLENMCSKSSIGTVEGYFIVFIRNTTASFKIVVHVGSKSVRLILFVFSFRKRLQRGISLSLLYRFSE